MSEIIQGKFKILFNKKIGRDYFRMAIYAPGIAKPARPGQFVHLRCQNSTEPLLRRPFSFHRLNKHNFEILYKVIGRGTNLLAKKQKGDTIDVLGPLGKGFDLKLATGEKRLATILVAGGMGVAPLLAVAEALVRGRKQNDIVVLLGAKNKKQILCAGDFKKLGARVQIATDDGSQGFRGFVSDLLKKVLRPTTNDQRPTTNDQRPTTIYACGPQPMLEEIARISQRYRISSQGSLEENMACGLGACLGCAIKTRVGYKRVCKDGPVFNLQEIEW